MDLKDCTPNTFGTRKPRSMILTQLCCRAALHTAITFVAALLGELNANRQGILRDADSQGCIVPEANPNGSIENIAGICNRERSVFGLMPHPDRASDARLGSLDGAKIFRSMAQRISASRAARRS